MREKFTVLEYNQKKTDKKRNTLRMDGKTTLSDQNQHIAIYVVITDAEEPLTASHAFAGKPLFTCTTP